MQKRKLLLSLVALCSIVGMGITSCNNEPVQGPQGEQGPVGPQGPAGENGENGEDGSLILHGEGKPADSLGKDTDVYIDSKTGDLYQKDNGTWTLVMNIKGEDGEDGEDGRPGLNGSQGSQGETAYSNTILPSEGGYVIPSVGSATSGSSITFYIHTNEGYSFESLELNDSKVTTLTYDEDGVGSYETTMPTNGFVVKANFVSVGTSGDTELDTSYFKDGYIYNDATLDAAGNVISGGKQGSKMFESGSGTESDPLVVKTLDQFNNIDDKSVVATPAVNFEIAENIKTTEALPIENRETTILDLGTHTLTVDSKTAGQVEQTKVGGGITEQTLVLNGEDGSKLVYNYGENNGGGSKTAIRVDGKGSVEVNNVDLESDGVPIAMFNDAASVSVSDSTVVGGNYGLSTNAQYGVNQKMSLEIKNSTVTAKNKGSAAVMFNVPGTLTISGSTIEGGRQGVFARVGSSKISKSTIIFAGDEEAIKYESHTWETGTNAPSAAILVGNNSSNPGYQESADLTLEDVILSQKGTGSDAEGSSLLADETGPTEHEFKLLYAHGYSEETKVTINVDSETMYKIAGKYCFNEHVDFKLDGQNVKVGPLFKDGNYYESATYLEDSEGNKTFLAGEVTTEKMFDGGDGLSESTPLLISSPTQLKNVSNNATIKSGAKYFKLTKDLVDENAITYLPTNYDSSAKKGEMILDLDDHKVEYVLNPNEPEEVFKDQGRSIALSENQILTIKNGSIDATDLKLKKDGDSLSLFSIGVSAKKAQLTLDHVDVTTQDWNPVYTQGINSKVDIIHSNLTGGQYGVGTNASQGGEETTPVTINISDSTISTLYKKDLNTHPQTNEFFNTALFINVGAKVTVTNSKLYADRQCVVVRGGDLTLNNVDLYYSGACYTKLDPDSRFDMYEENSTWSSGNGVPIAGVLVGNDKKNAYSNYYKISFTNVTIQEVTSPSPAADIEDPTEGNTKPEKPYLLYANAESADRTVELTFDQASWGQFYLTDGSRIYHNDDNVKVTIDGEEYNWKISEVVEP